MAHWSRICLQFRRPGFDPWVGKIPWRREWQATPVVWPGEFHGLYSPWGRRFRHDWATFTFTSVQLFVTLWTPASLSTEFPKQELVWFATAFSRGSSWPRDWTRVSRIAGRFLPLSHQGSPTKAREQPKCVSKAERVKKMWYIDAAEYYLAMEKNEIMPFYSNMDRSRDYHTR